MTEKGVIDYDRFKAWMWEYIPQLQWHATLEEIEIVVKLLCSALDLPLPSEVKLLKQGNRQLSSTLMIRKAIADLDKEYCHQLLFHTQRVREYASVYCARLDNFFLQTIYHFFWSNSGVAIQLPCCGVAAYLGVPLSTFGNLLEALRGLVGVTFRGGIAYTTPGPSETLWKGRQLHNDKGAAVKFSVDGWKDLYFLNGVKVPKWLVATREGDLDPRKVLELKNAEVRREFVRKVGIERICYSLKAVVRDRVGNYELLLLFLDDNRPRPYLKMLNPSIDTWHVEGVPPQITTVEQALRWRNQTTEEPEILM